MKWRRPRMLWSLLIVALIGSLGVNVVLWMKLNDKLIEVADVRSDPYGDRKFEKANRELSPADPSKTRILLFGDSRIANWTQLPKLENTEIINRGIGGQTTSQLTGRIEKDVLALNPDLVVIQAGINDLKEIGILPQFHGPITDRCISNLVRIKQRLAEAKIPVLIMTVFANGPIEIQRRPFWSARINDAIDRVNREIISWTDDHVYVFDSGQVLEDESGRVQREYALDGLHLTPLGYQALNKTITPMMERLIHDGAE